MKQLYIHYGRFTYALAREGALATSLTNPSHNSYN